MIRCIVLADAAAVEAESARRLVQALAHAQAERGAAALALAGGKTPAGIYRRLATSAGVDWKRVHVFWGDERAVAPDAPDSNARLARDTLLDHVPIPAAHVHPMPAAPADLERGAREYEALLCDLLGRPPRLDIVLLGLGSDAHTASLFPESAALAESERFVVATPAPVIAPRLTLTVPALRAAHALLVAAHGTDKAAALQRTLYARRDPQRVPLHALREHDLTFIVDRSAASRLGASASAS